MKFLPVFAILILSFLVLNCPQLAHAAEWHTANQVTIAWDEVSVNVDGTPVSPNEVSYKVWIYNALTDPNHENPIELGQTSDLSYLITLNVEGRYFPGVQTIRTVDGEQVAESAIIWASDPLYDWGLQYFVPMPAPEGFRKQ